MFAFKLDRKTEAEGTYPIVLVSYLLACTQYGSADEAAVVKGYVEYVISPEGQEAAAENAGSAPLSASLTEKITPAVEAIEGRLGPRGPGRHHDQCGSAAGGGVRRAPPPR